ncbi:MAG: hypothetical protein R3E98_19980 [Gemmatimonadota bacterium]
MTRWYEGGPARAPRLSAGRAAVCLLVLGTSACGASGDGRGGNGALPEDPSARYAAVEQRLLDAESVSLAFHVTSEGAFTADLEGTLHTSADRTELAATGTFGGGPVDVRLLADGDAYRFGSATAPTNATRPAALEEALLVGLMRMGVLHNLAMLTAGQGADHAEGGVREWVVVDGLTDAATGDGVRFDITVAATPSGSATLLLDERGLPRERTQVVQFPNGEMRVVERYTRMETTG